MCGIAGLFNFSKALREPVVAERVVRRMMDSIVYRGPDAEGIWVDQLGRCVLGHRRLSIIDTSDAGRQPMSGHAGSWIITFNGEIYNFQEMRRELEATGTIFCGRTDTEVLLAGIAKWGVEVLPRLDGMFAFAAFNRESGEILLARDPFGEKPLYYMELAGGGLAFASELHCLEILPGFETDLSLDAMAEVLMFQYIGAPRTIYQSVKKLQPGHWLRCSPDLPLEIGRHFEFAPGRAGFDRRSIGDLADELEELLVTSLRRRLISDVPLGAFLSGGVDSSTVCALIRKRLGVPLKTFSVGFEGAEESEHEIACQFAQHLCTEHHERVLCPDTAHFLEEIGRVLDEPNADSSCMPTFLLSQFARQQVTVAISGDGGDEMFGGYGRYFDTLLDQQRIGARFPSSWRPGPAYYSERILVFDSAAIEGLFGCFPDGLARHLSALQEKINQSKDNLLRALRKTDVDNYLPGAVLPKVDRMSMRHSLEVRTPFLNVALARFAERLPPEVMVRRRHGKLILRELAYRYLPKSLVDMPKKGFGIPMSEWGKGELLSLAERTLKSDDSRLLEMLGHERINGFLSRQGDRGGFAAYQVWGVVMLESWLRAHSCRLPKLIATKVRGKTLRAGLPPPPLSAGWIAPHVLAVLPRTMTQGSRGPCDSVEKQEQRDRFSTVIAGLCCELRVESFAPRFNEGQAKFDARDLPAEEENFVEALSKAGFPLHGATVVIADPQSEDSATPETLLALWKAGAKELCCYRLNPPNFRVTCFNAKGTLRRMFDIARLRVRAIARWSLLWSHHSKGFLYVSGPFRKLPIAADEELSHQVMMFEGWNQLPPIVSSHEDISCQGEGRYSVWNQHIFFSSLVSRKPRWRGMLRTYWAVENNARNAPLLPMSIPSTQKTRLPGSDLASRLERYMESINHRSPYQPSVGEESKRVVVLTHSLQPGGAERQWCYLAIGLKRMGYDVKFLTESWLEGEKAHYGPLLAYSGLEVCELGRVEATRLASSIALHPDAHALLTPDGSPFGIRLAQLVTLLDEFRPAAIYAQLDSINILAGVAGTIAGTPKIILSFRNVNPSNFSYLQNEWFLPCYRALIKNPSIILSGNSSVGCEDYAHWIGISPDKVNYIGNGISDELVRRVGDDVAAPITGMPDPSSSDLLILGVFRLSEEKRPLLFLDVCEKIHAIVPEVRVLIAGVGPLDAALAMAIQQRGISDYLKLLGRRDDVHQLMQVSSLLLLTSSFEGTPNVVMEAQALGVPVVATKVGGVADIVVDGETGFLADKDDEAALADRCVRILLDKTIRVRMGMAAKSRMAKLFSVETMVKQYLELIPGDG